MVFGNDSNPCFSCHSVRVWQPAVLMAWSSFDVTSKWKLCPMCTLVCNNRMFACVQRLLSGDIWLDCKHSIRISFLCTLKAAGRNLEYLIVLPWIQVYHRNKNAPLWQIRVLMFEIFNRYLISIYWINWLFEKGLFVGTLESTFKCI